MTLKISAAEPQASSVRIADIVRDSRFQMRPTTPGIVKRYASVLRSGKALPPVTLAQVNGALVCVDGGHRIAAHEALQREVIEATVVPCTAREALWMAASANLAHGLPLKPKEVRKAFCLYIAARKHRHAGEVRNLKSYREIAADLGGIVSHVTVRNWMMSEFPRIAEQMSNPDEPHGGDFTQAAPRLSDTALSAIQQATAAARGVKKPDERGALVHAAEGLLREVKDGGPWEYPFGVF